MTLGFPILGIVLPYNGTTEADSRSWTILKAQDPQQS